MTRTEMIAELRGMETGGSQFSNDIDVANLCIYAGQAVRRRVLGDQPLRDLDAEDAADPKKHYKVPGQEDQGVKEEPDMA